MDITQKQNTPKMFDRIAFRYDVLNTIVSIGSHKIWRKKVAGLLVDEEGQHVLDLATGTGDQIISLLKTGKVKSIIGLDPSVEMITIGERKIARRFPKSDVTLVEADAADIPFLDNEFDAITMAFGIRNVPDADRVLRESYRTLKQGGRLIILESSIPSNKVLRFFNDIYLTVVIRWLAGILSGNLKAYKYLNKSIKAFPSGEDFAKMIRHSGFEDVKVLPMMLGSVTIYQADKK